MGAAAAERAAVEAAKGAAAAEKVAAEVVTVVAAVARGAGGMAGAAMLEEAEQRFRWNRELPAAGAWVQQGRPCPLLANSRARPSPGRRARTAAS